MLKIKVRRIVEVNTDPQRRCYSGAHAKSEMRWTAWEVIQHVPQEKAEETLKFWRDLNDYAVSQRGISAKCEYEIDKEILP